jgi:hypothetical protein
MPTAAHPYSVCQSGHLSRDMSGAEALAIVIAIATLTSGFSGAVHIVSQLKARWRDRRASRTSLASLTALGQLQRTLSLTRSTVQRAYDEPSRRFGQAFRAGDGTFPGSFTFEGSGLTPRNTELSRYILFSLAARQETLLRDLQDMDVSNANIQRLITRIEGTRIAATRCLNDLATRTQRPNPPLPLGLQGQVELLMDYQNLCHSAVLYRTGQRPHSQLAEVSSNHGKSACHRCGAILTSSKMRIPGADRNSYVLINLSGLFRSHCHAGSGLTCIWQLRVMSCYGVFENEKALLKHIWRSTYAITAAQRVWKSIGRRISGAGGSRSAATLFGSTAGRC